MTIARNYAAIDSKTHQIARSFPCDQLGLEMAYSLARRHGYEVWETIDGKPQYLVHTARGVGNDLRS